MVVVPCICLLSYRLLLVVGAVMTVLDVVVVGGHNG